MPPLSPEQKWLRVLFVLASVIAVATWGYFHFFEWLWGIKRTDAVIGLIVFAAICLAISLPVICLTALFRPRRRIIAVGAVHAAALSSFTALLSSTVDSRDWLGIWLSGIFMMAVFAEILLLSIADSMRRKWKHPSYPISSQMIFGSILTATLCGWIAGTYIWSFEVPLKVITAAEASANGQPYCLESADGDDITNIFALNALNLYNPSRNSTGTYHALLVIGEGEERRYMNWSYRKGNFDLVGGHTWGTRKHCTPEVDFVKKLPFLFK